MLLYSVTLSGYQVNRSKRSSDTEYYQQNAQQDHFRTKANPKLNLDGGTISTYLISSVYQRL